MTKTDQIHLTGRANNVENKSKELQIMSRIYSIKDKGANLEFEPPNKNENSQSIFYKWLIQEQYRSETW